MLPSLSTIAAAAKRNELANHLVRYAFGGNRAVQETISWMEAGDEAARRSLQDRLVQRLLRRARRTPFGKGRELDIGRWPIVDKRLLRSRPSDFEIRYIPKISSTTSGSSGEPLRVWRGIGNITAEQCFLDSFVRRAGLEFKTARIAILRGDTPRVRTDAPARFFELLGNRRLIMASSALSAQTAHQFIDCIENFSPDLLWVYPTAGDMLATACLSQGRRVSVRMILSGSEMLSDGAMLRMRTAFSAPVVDYYGQAERVAMSFRVDAERGFFLPAYGKVELLPVKSDVPSEKVARARIVGSGFWNDVMPLVRYDTGDLVEFDSSYGARELELVSLGILPFGRIIGRAEQFLKTRTGGNIQALGTVAKDFDVVRQAQFIQESDYSIELKLLIADKVDRQVLAQLEANARRIIPKDLDFKISVVEELERTANGKTPFVICRVSQ